MNRYAVVASVVLLTATAASAHFVFFVPDGDADAVKAIFSDTLKPDGQVNIEKIDNTKLFVIDAAGNESALKWALDKQGSFFAIAAPGSGTRIVAGVTDYGILQRGETKPFWLKYYPKTILGAIPAADKALLGKRVPLEIVPIVEAGKIRFQAVVGGAPAAKTEISVITPGDEKAQELTTDEKGLTPAFEKAGQYGVRLRHIEMKSGEDQGKKYDELRHYATLVVNFSPPR
jgi:uncharacterized GH25 family protein